MKLRLGVGQIKNETDLQNNFSKIKKCLSVFSKNNVELAIFPECALSGFSAAMRDVTDEVLRPMLEDFLNISNTDGIAILLPTGIKKGEIYNTGFYFNNNEIKQFYKIGLTDSEKKFFSAPSNYQKEIFEIKSFKFFTLICMEAQESAYKYFKPDDVDFIVWPGYWGWKKNDTWNKIKSDGEECLVFENMTRWQIPLIQANFAYNDFSDARSDGPHGMSMIVNSDNSLFNTGAIDQESCLIVDLEKKSRCQFTFFDQKFLT